MNQEEKTIFKAPPRLLLGVAFLFWGAMHERAGAALVAAILMEARHWTALRWEFGIKGFARAWQLCMLVVIVSVIGLIRGGQLTSDDFLDLLSWLPFMMLPLALAQQFAREAGVPSVAFSFVARRKIEADKRAGRPVELSHLHLGYPFLLLVLITAGMGVGNLAHLGGASQYAVGVLLLLGWAFFSLAGKRERPWAWTTAYFAAIAVSCLILWALAIGYQHFLRGGNRSDQSSATAFETQTAIGDVHELHLSPQILWRYLHEGGEVPNLLKLAAYNEPRRRTWRARGRGDQMEEKIADDRTLGADFEKLLSDEEGDFRYQEEKRSPDQYEHVGRLVGLTAEEALIPHPTGTNRFEGVPAEILAVNSLGSFQMTGVTQGAMEVGLYAGEGDRPIELDPAVEDLIYLKYEAEGLEAFLREIGLEVPRARPERNNFFRPFAETSTAPPALTVEEFREIEARIGLTFRESFSYTTLLKNQNAGSPISEFLKEGNRSGHCEYFAGASAMLLRRMGVPTRYVVGFAVQERGKEAEWILRGHHAHAWAQAYVGGRWVNEGTEEEAVWRCRGGEWVTVDLTPPDWGNHPPQLAWSQWFADLFQKLRANLVLWISHPSVALGFQIVIAALVIPGLLFLIYRLVVTRRREGSCLKGSWADLALEKGKLRDFERWLGKRVGPRPAGLPMGTWLREHLPENGGLVDQYERATYRDPEGVWHEEDAGDSREMVRTLKARWREHQKTPEAKSPRG